MSTYGMPISRQALQRLARQEERSRLHHLGGRLRPMAGFAQPVPAVAESELLTCPGSSTSPMAGLELKYPG